MSHVLVQSAVSHSHLQRLNVRNSTCNCAQNVLLTNFTEEFSIVKLPDKEEQYSGLLRRFQHHVKVL